MNTYPLVASTSIYINFKLSTVWKLNSSELNFCMRTEISKLRTIVTIGDFSTITRASIKLFSSAVPAVNEQLSLYWIPFCAGSGSSTWIRNIFRIMTSDFPSSQPTKCPSHLRLVAYYMGTANLLSFSLTPLFLLLFSIEITPWLWRDADLSLECRTLIALNQTGNFRQIITMRWRNLHHSIPTL